ncbi:MAG: transporter substrate-binding domain-containing protein [Bacteroidota bacterium]
MIKQLSLLLILALSGGVLPGQTQEDTLRVGVQHEPPFVIKQGADEYGGLCLDLWRSIAEEQGKFYELHEYSDHLGLIRGLDFGQIDVAINPIHVNEIRLQLLDVTQPFFVTEVGVATSQAERSQLGLFLSNFFSLDFLRIVLLLVLIIFVFGTILWLAERRHNRQQFRPGWIGLFDGLWWSAVTMTTVGYGDKAPKSRLGRVIAMVWMFTAIIIISGFTATIASTLTVNSLSRTIEDIEDLRDLSTLGSVYASSSEDFLRLNQIEVTQLYESPTEALSALARQEIEVLVYDQTVLDYQINHLDLANKVSLLPISFNQQYRSFFLPKNSLELEWINPLLVRRINEASWRDLLRAYNLSDE